MQFPGAGEGGDIKGAYTSLQEKKCTESTNEFKYSFYACSKRSGNMSKALSNSHIILTDKMDIIFGSYSTSKCLPVDESSVQSALKWFLPWNQNETGGGGEIYRFQATSAHSESQTEKR